MTGVQTCALPICDSWPTPDSGHYIIKIATITTDLLETSAVQITYHQCFHYGGSSLPEDPDTAVDTIGSNDEEGGTGGDEDDAATDNKTLDGSDSNGIELWMCSRVAYDDVNDETLYGYARKLTFDQYGRLYSVSAESKYTIDVPVAES